MQHHQSSDGVVEGSGVETFEISENSEMTGHEAQSANKNNDEPVSGESAKPKSLSAEEEYAAWKEAQLKQELAQAEAESKNIGPGFRRIVYRSRLHPGVDIGNLVYMAREFNIANGIGGFLTLNRSTNDVLQMIEGDKKELFPLWDRIQRDSQHTVRTELTEITTPERKWVSEWGMAMLEPAEVYILLNELGHTKSLLPAECEIARAKNVDEHKIGRNPFETDDDADWRNTMPSFDAMWNSNRPQLSAASEDEDEFAVDLNATLLMKQVPIPAMWSHETPAPSRTIPKRQEDKCQGFFENRVSKTPKELSKLPPVLFDEETGRCPDDPQKFAEERRRLKDQSAASSSITSFSESMEEISERDNMTSEMHD